VPSALADRARVGGDEPLPLMQARWRVRDSEMVLDEFARRLDALWRERYALYDPALDHWTRQRQDDQARQQCRDMLMEYAHAVQQVGVSRRGKNRAQRLFDELGIDPVDLELDRDSAAIRPSEYGASAKAPLGRIMYIERKAGQLTGDARIGRVTCSKSGRTLYYGGKSFRPLVPKGFKSNYLCVETGEDYWISGCKRDGSDRLYGERVPVHIDDEVREEYWTHIRSLPENKERRTA
jgi:hypothetical protein